MITEQYKYDELSDTLHIKRSEDVSHILDVNKKQYDVDNKRYNQTFNHVARIPIMAIEMYCKTHGIKYEEFMTNEKLFKQFLNDPDNKYFRTKPGRI